MNSAVVDVLTGELTVEMIQEEERLLALEEPRVMGDRLELSDDEDEFDEHEEQNDAFSRPDSVWARPTSFNFGSSGRASIQALAARSVVNDRKKSLEQETYSHSDNGNKACEKFQLDLTGTTFGVCKCGFKKTDHGKRPEVCEKSTEQELEIEGHLSKLSSKQIWMKRFFKLSLRPESPSLMYYPNVRNAWNMMKRGKKVLQDGKLVKVEIKMLEIHLTAENGSVAALKASNKEDAVRFYEGLKRLIAIHAGEAAAAAP